MMRHLIILLSALFLASASWSQEAEDPAADTEAEATETSETSDTSEASDEEEDDSDLDEQGYAGEEEEDDFIPSKEVTADQSIPFPVDI
jgi:uncharacterized membrane-anchored protein